MKSLIILYLAVTGLAATIPVKRQVAVIQKVLQQIQTGVTSLDTTVVAFQGDPTQLLGSFNSLLTTLQTGAKTINASQQIALTDALSLQNLQQGFQQSTAKLQSDFLAKKPVIQQNNLCGQVSMSLNQFAVAGQGLLGAIVTRLPAGVQGLAGGATGPFQKQLTDTIAAFAPGNCTNAGGSTTAPGGLSGAGTGTATGPSSSGSTPIPASSTGLGSGTTGGGIAGAGTTGSGITGLGSGTAGTGAGLRAGQSGSGLTGTTV